MYFRVTLTQTVANAAEIRNRFSRAVPKAMKRGADVALAILLLVLSFPLLFAIALVVMMDGGPALFRHQRVGCGGQLFPCLKFRTMLPDAESCLVEFLECHADARDEWALEHKLSFDPRVTPVGRFLRSSSLDELPQLLNVIRGEMSFVGPRPITPAELKRYGVAGSAYLSVRPGITGAWQVSGRNDTNYAARVAIDTSYVKDWSLVRDLQILAMTPAVVLSRKGAR
jgi:lipopolysaccharide/colanic/teichoic acid biosynthesis glycosyltransferase